MVKAGLESGEVIRGCWQTEPNIMPSQSRLSRGLWYPRCYLRLRRQTALLAAALRCRQGGVSRDGELGLAVLWSGDKPSNLTGRLEGSSKKESERRRSSRSKKNCIPKLESLKAES
jgi:hypothetical protein